MLPNVIRSAATVAALTGMLAWPVQPALAQTAPAKTIAPPAVQITVEGPNAERTRQQLMELLERFPPSVGRVLKLDPSLLSNADYMATYPSLAAFLAQHPDVARNPSYYFERVRVPAEYIDARSNASRVWSDLLGWMGGLAIATLIAVSLGWLIRLLVDYRRWYRLSKVQAEAHTKVLDRLTANEELLAYVQSPAGSRFLESTPIALDPGTRRIGAPFGRILWSAQAGIVLTALGLGMRYVSGRFADTDASQPLYALGVLGVALGLGFLLSTGVAYVLSQRLGLIDRAARE
jgi:hypothetical protein